MYVRSSGTVFVFELCDIRVINVMGKYASDEVTVFSDVRTQTKMRNYVYRYASSPRCVGHVPVVGRS